MLQVLSISETGQAHPLLRIRVLADGQAAPGGEESSEGAHHHHLIPYVPQIVPSMDAEAGVCVCVTSGGINMQ